MGHEYTEYKKPERGILPESFYEEQRVVKLLEVMHGKAGIDGDFKFVSEHLPELIRRVQWLMENSESWKMWRLPSQYEIH